MAESAEPRLGEYRSLSRPALGGIGEREREVEREEAAEPEGIPLMAFDRFRPRRLSTKARGGTALERRRRGGEVSLGAAGSIICRFIGLMVMLLIEGRRELARDVSGWERRET